MTGRTLSLCRAAFARWKGGDVEFVELRRSARTAFLLVTTNTGRFAVHLLDPKRIEAAIRWRNCDLAIEEVAGDEPMFEVTDASAGFKVVCGGVAVGDAPAKWGA